MIRLLQEKVARLSKHNCSVMMDDDECVLKYIEIVPRDNSSNCYDVKQEPVQLQVCIEVIWFIYVFHRISIRSFRHGFRRKYLGTIPPRTLRQYPPSKLRQYPQHIEVPRFDRRDRDSEWGGLCQGVPPQPTRGIWKAL